MSDPVRQRRLTMARIRSGDVYAAGRAGLPRRKASPIAARVSRWMTYSLDRPARVTNYLTRLLPGKRRI